jgi:hypothetical protein
MPSSGGFSLIHTTPLEMLVMHMVVMRFPSRVLKATS